MNDNRRRPRDGAGVGRDGFPCWIGCDAHGIRALAWESVRLVEWIEESGSQATTDDRRQLEPASDIVICRDDGQELPLAFVAFCPDEADFIESAFEAIYAHRRLCKEAGKVPTC